MIRVLILGAGGHGRVVLDILRAAGGTDVVGFLDNDPALAGAVVNDVPVLGPFARLADLATEQRAAAAVVAVGANAVRRRWVGELVALGLEAVNAIHPRATLSPRATLGRGLVIGAGAIVGTDVTLGDAVIVNTGAQADHECRVAAGVHLAPGSILAGRVTVGEDAFVGLGARVIQGLTIGASATVGAGAVVVRDVESGTLVVGVPARPRDGVIG